MRCSRCRAAYFCGPTCQLRSWKKHQSFCISFKTPAYKEEQSTEAQVPTCDSSESTAESDISDNSDQCTFDDFVSSGSPDGAVHNVMYQHEGVDTCSSAVHAADVAIAEVIPAEPQPIDIDDVKLVSDAGEPLLLGSAAWESHDIWSDTFWVEAYSWGRSDATSTTISAQAKAKDCSTADMEPCAYAPSATQKMQTGADDGCCVSQSASPTKTAVRINRVAEKLMLKVGCCLPPLKSIASIGLVKWSLAA